MLDIYRAAARVFEEGRLAALATIIGTEGSTPGKEAAKMLVLDDGRSIGTVGGGCTEAEVWRLAMEVIATDRPIRTSFRITAATAAQTGLLCGGEFEVFIEPIGNPSAYIFGAGHIARALTPLLAALEYRTVVIDDRESYATREHFPAAAEILVRDFDRALDGLSIPPHSYLIVVTRGHLHDEAVLSQALRSAARYVGIIGSRGKVGAILKHLRAAGVSESDLARVRGPIGLAIGARTPQESAIAIAAEMVAFRRGAAPPASPRGSASPAAPAQ